MPTYASKSSRELEAFPSPPPPVSTQIHPLYSIQTSSLTTAKAPTSKVVEGLTHSQGSIALISALLSGFAFQALTTLTVEYSDLDSDFSRVVYILFIIVTSLTIASFLYVAVSCSLLEQNGLITRSLALSSKTSSNFDVHIENWYFKDQKFVTFRHRLIHLFTSSFILFSLFCSLFCLVRVDGPAGYASSAIFFIFGGIMTAQVSTINARFVEGILNNA